MERGVARPSMAPEPDEGDDQQEGGGGGPMDHGAPHSERRYEMLRAHHAKTLWVYWSLIMLGAFTMLAPFNFGYLNEALFVEPSGGRGVWFSDGTHTALRAWLMTVSDVVSGALLIVLGWRSLRPDRPVSRWLACGVGAWMSAAPILFWAPTMAAYLNGTLVGMLVMALAILIPGMPNMVLFMKMGGETPPGWSYNPSSWAQRWIMIATGFAGLLASRYLAMYQLGYVEEVWDPFFGDGSRLVLDSNMSHSLPISDAGLGALAYTFEFLMGFMGSPKRWRTMPWMVAFFGFLVIPLGLVHIMLVISQPVVVGHWCTFCLVAAGIMLPMIPLEVDEVIAMGQHLRDVHRRGDSVWSAFWKGGAAGESQEDERSPALESMSRHPLRVLAASVVGMSVPLTLGVSMVLGVGLMATPGAFAVRGSAADVYHLAGALIVVVSVIVMGEVLRAGRALNVILGLAVAVLPWVLTGAPLAVRIGGTIVGLVVAALAWPRGVVKEHYGRWDRLVR